MRADIHTSRYALLAVPAAVLSAGIVVHSSLVVLRSATVEPVVSFALALALVNLLAVRLPRGDVLVLDGAMVVGALLIYGSAVAVVASCIGGLLGSVWARGSSGDRHKNMLDLTRRILVVWAVAFAGGGLLPAGTAIMDLKALLLAMLVGLMYMSLDLGSYAVAQAIVEQTEILESAQSVARSVFFLYVGQVCLGIALAIVHRGMGFLAVGVLGVLAMILLNAFNMYLRTKIMYQQTINALSRASSLQLTGPHPDSRLVADLCVAVGRRLGMHGEVLERLSYAALLCDIGRLGSLELESDGDEHAADGASLVESVPFLVGTADMIRHHHRPYDSLELPQSSDALGAGIIHVCGDFIARSCAAGMLSSYEGRLTCLQTMQQVGVAEYGERLLAVLGDLLRDPRSARRYNWEVQRPC